MTNETNDDATEQAPAPVIPPLVRSPYPTRSRRRQLQQQRMMEAEGQLTEDPLGLLARTSSGGSAATSLSTSANPSSHSVQQDSATSAPEPPIASTVTTRRRRQPPPPASRSSTGMHASSSLFSTPSAPSTGDATGTAQASSHYHAASVPQSATSHVSVASDYMIGRGLVQARISPMAGSTAPGSGSAKNSRRRRFFPPSRPSTGGTSIAGNLGSSNDAAPSPAVATARKGTTGETNKTSNDQTKVPIDNAVVERDLILDGMNITKLRNLTLSCLGILRRENSSHAAMTPTTQSPKMAVFFAGIVHSKTQDPEDAYVYARALLQNEQPKRTVKWIEQVNLLRCYYSEQNLSLVKTDQDDANNNDETIDQTKKETKHFQRFYERLEQLKTLQVESLLLAAQSLAELSDWAEVLQLLEDTQYYTFPESHQQMKEHLQQNQPQGHEMGETTNNMDHDDTENSFHPNHMTIVTTANAGVHSTTNAVMTMSSPTMPMIPQHLDDDDDIAWQQLAESLRPRNASNSSSHTPETIHPLSRICQLRARAYSELGHPLRANLYWNRALKIDPWCVLALEGLLETSVQAPASVVESVLMAMSRNAVQNDESPRYANSNDDAEWLRALYLARVCTAAPSTAHVKAGSLDPSNGIENGNNPVAQDPDDPMEDETDENDDGNGDENMTPFALTPNAPSRSARAQIHSNEAANEHDANQPEVGVANTAGDDDGSNDPSFWQDASSIQLLTPIPQQQSMVDMSAAGTSLFFPQSGSKPNSSVFSTNKDYSSLISSLPPAQAKALAVGSALDTLWNKFQLRNSPEVLAMAAQNAYRRYDWNAALQFCDELSELDPLSSNTNKAAFCHVSTLVQLHRKRPLFRLAHEWVETNPKEARSWFAVGAYYYACERYHVAQRHFCRATRLDPHCVEAWIAFGASFAACDESDQALASFRAAQRLAPGNHTSLLYIAMEYLRTNHLVLAQHFLKAANDSSGGTDPLVKTETGVLKLNQKKYLQAITWFLMALGGDSEWASAMNKVLLSSVSSDTVDTNPKYLDALSRLVETIQDPYWEPTLFNLAHAYRKERRFDASVICLQQCLALKESPSAHSALGFCLHLQSLVISTHCIQTEKAMEFAKRTNQPQSPTTTAGLKHDRSRSNRLLHKAIDAYHQSLAKKPDDPFASEMLQKALGDALEQTDFFLSDDDINASYDDPPVVSDHHSALASPAASFQGNNMLGNVMESSNRKVRSAHHHHHHHHTPKPPRESLGSLSTTTTGMGMGSSNIVSSSLWTDDGLSVSADDSTNGDVDMT